VSAAGALPVTSDGYRVGLVRQGMGTLVSVVALHSSGAQAEDAIEAAFAEMGRLAGLLTRHDSASPLAELNALGRLRDAPPELAQLLDRALIFHGLTSGAFDVTVKPMLDLLESSGGKASPQELAEAAELVGAAHVALCGRAVGFDRAGMGVTLDGIAKGYIVDRMADTLAARGIRSFLVNAGGDVRASGGKEGGRPWTIGVRDPANPGALCDVVEITTGAVATSGNYLRQVEHIVDPGAGERARRSASVSVIAREATAADALATALFVVGPAGRLPLVLPLAGCECLVLGPHGESVKSRGWPSSMAKGDEYE
jgi:thiamine biosynthesis lipoprotein